MSHDLSRDHQLINRLSNVMSHDMSRDHQLINRPSNVMSHDMSRDHQLINRLSNVMSHDMSRDHQLINRPSNVMSCSVEQVGCELLIRVVHCVVRFIFEGTGRGSIIFFFPRTPSFLNRPHITAHSIKY